MVKQEPSRPLRVLHVVLSLDCGGLERVVLDLIRGGQSWQQQVSVVCLERRGALAEEAESLGAQVHCAHKPPGLAFSTKRDFRNLLAHLKPDVVHTHQIGALYHGGGTARRVGTPAIVHTEHGLHYRDRLRTRVLAAFAARHAHRFFCVSEEIAADIRRFRIARPQRVHCVRNGVDTRRFARVSHAAALRASFAFPADAVVIGTVGRLNEVKRQEVLIRGFSRLLQRMPHARLLLVGDGPCRQELTQLTEHLGLTGEVKFAGYQSQTEHYLQAMDVFALTSRTEGMPLAVLEAWSAGLPVVASRVGSLSELIDEETTGLLFAPGDDGELANQLERVLEDSAFAERLGVAGQSRARSEFDISNMVENYHRHYLGLLNGRWMDHDARPGDHQPLPQPVSASAGDVQPPALQGARERSRGEGRGADRVDR